MEFQNFKEYFAAYQKIEDRGKQLLFMHSFYKKVRQLPEFEREEIWTEARVMAKDLILKIDNILQRDKKAES